MCSIVVSIGLRGQQLSHSARHPLIQEHLFGQPFIQNAYDPLYAYDLSKKRLLAFSAL